jgi:hypothetical protein
LVQCASKPAAAAASRSPVWAVAGQRNEAHLATNRAELAREIVAAHPRQADVEHAHVEPGQPRTSDRFGPAVRNRHDVSCVFEHGLQHVPRIVIVVDDEDASCRCRTQAIGMGLLEVFRSRRRKREINDHARALIAAAARVQLDRAVVELDERAGERETQTESSLSSIEGARSLCERVEHRRPQLRGDSRAVVLAHHHDAADASDDCRRSVSATCARRAGTFRPSASASAAAVAALRSADKRRDTTRATTRPHAISTRPPVSTPPIDARNGPSSTARGTTTTFAHPNCPRLAAAYRRRPDGTNDGATLFEQPLEVLGFVCRRQRGVHRQPGADQLPRIE